MKLMGHSSIVVSQRYVHPSTDAMQRAMKGLENGAPLVHKSLARNRKKRSKSLLRNNMGA